MEAETSVMLQEIMTEILLKHLEKVCGLKYVKEKDEVVLEKTPDQLKHDEIVQMLRLLQEIMRISLETQTA